MGMKKLEEIANQYDTKYQAAKALGVPQWQLQRWLNYGAWVDAKGRILKQIGKVSSDH